VSFKFRFWVCISMLLSSFPGCSQDDSRGLVPDSLRVRITSEKQDSQTQVLLQAVSVVDEDTVWVSGHEGTYMLTVDGGLNWIARTLTGGETLEFRDVEAFNARTAYLLSSGVGDLSKR